MFDTEDQRYSRGIWAVALTGVGILTEPNSPKETRLLGVRWIAALAEEIIRKTKSIDYQVRILLHQWLVYMMVQKKR